MKKIMILAALLLSAGKLFAADAVVPAVIEITGQSGPLNGYVIVAPAYEFRLMCSGDYGFSGFEVSKGGEKFFTDSTPFSIYDEEKGEYFFQTSPGYRQEKRNFAITRDDKGNKISWVSASGSSHKIDYDGRVEYGPNRVSVTQRWTVRGDLKKGRVTVANLLLGIPALTGCSFRALLNDGSAVEGSVPGNLPAEETLYAGGRPNGSLKEITFDTGQGKVKVTFVPDEYWDGACIGEPALATALNRDWGGLTSRRYEFLCRFPAGRQKLARSYTVIFEFPE